MSIELLISILIGAICIGWLGVHLFRFKDWRIGILVLMFGLLCLHQILHASEMGWQFKVTFFSPEFPGLIVSILGLILVINFPRLIHAANVNTTLDSRISGPSIFDKIDTTTLLIPLFILFFLILTGSSLWGINRLSEFSKEHEKAHSRHHSHTINENLYLNIGNAIQESYSYIASGDIREKEEFYLWSNKFPDVLDSYADFSRGTPKGLEIQTLLLELQDRQDELRKSAEKLFEEYERMGRVNIESFDIYENQIDNFMPLAEELNRIEIENSHALESFFDNAFKASIRLDKFNYLLLLSMLAIFAVLTIWLIKNIQLKNKIQIDQQRHEQLILDSIPAMIWQKDDKNNIVNLNRAAAESVGKSIREVKGLNASEIYPYEANDYLQDDLDVINSNEPKLNIIEQYQAEAKKLWIRTDKYPLNLDNESDDKGVLVISTDVTEQKETQEALEKSEELLAHAERLNTLGQLSSSIAHELNQPLTSISQFCTSAKIRFKKLNYKDDNLARYIDSSIEQAKRAGEIIRRIRSLVKQESTHRVLADINKIIIECIQILRNEVQLENTRVTFSLNDLLPKINIDVIQIQQVLINLIRNSLAAMGSSPKIPKQILIKTTKDDNFIIISLQDTGPGIAHDKIDSIFDPYISTNSQGIGLGLSISKSIIEAHHGKIWFDPDVRDGAIVYFTLPLNRT